MRDVVLDASAGGKLFRDEPGADALRAWIAAHIDDARFLVPPVFRHEVLNVAAKALQHGAFPDVASAMAGWDACMALVEERTIASNEIVAAAADLSLTSHDAAYVALARQADCPLISFDARQVKAAQRCVQVINPL